MIPDYFRGKKVPEHIRNKTQLIAWALEQTYIEDDWKAITNWEMVVELGSHRFGGIIHNLRKEGYKIVTVKGTKKGHNLYYCEELPSGTASYL
tara:strand:+ start:149 stop:427 length:279 start_codon:yes stop_codon:yes gene_type:complete